MEPKDPPGKENSGTKKKNLTFLRSRLYMLERRKTDTVVEGSVSGDHSGALRRSQSDRTEYSQKLQGAEGELRCVLLKAPACRSGTQMAEAARRFSRTTESSFVAQFGLGRWNVLQTQGGDYCMTMDCTAQRCRVAHGKACSTEPQTHPHSTARRHRHACGSKQKVNVDTLYTSGVLPPAPLLPTSWQVLTPTARRKLEAKEQRHLTRSLNSRFPEKVLLSIRRNFSSWIVLSSHGTSSVPLCQGLPECPLCSRCCTHQGGGTLTLSFPSPKPAQSSHCVLRCTS